MVLKASAIPEPILPFRHTVQAHLDNMFMTIKMSLTLLLCLEYATNSCYF